MCSKFMAVCLFACMSTRACQLELVDDLSTDHFIMALKRFIARRGRLQRMFSDNDTNSEDPTTSCGNVSSNWMSREYRSFVHQKRLENN